MSNSTISGSLGWSYIEELSIIWPLQRYALYILCFRGSSAGKESACNVGDLGSIPGLGRFPAEGKDYLLQYSSLSHRILQDTENIVSEYWEYSLEYWAPGQRIPWTVLSSPWGHKDSDTTEQLSLWQRKWQPTPVFLPGKSHGQRSLAGYNPWGSKEWD